MERKTGYKVLFYQKENGSCPAEDFLDRLPLKIRAKTAKWIEKLGEFGPDLPRPYADVVKGKIRELRVIFSSLHCRFLYFFYGKNIVVTHGFIKKTDKVQEEEINKAHSAMLDFEIRIKKGEIST